MHRNIKGYMYASVWIFIVAIFLKNITDFFKRKYVTFPNLFDNNSYNFPSMLTTLTKTPTRVNRKGLSLNSLVTKQQLNTILHKITTKEWNVHLI